jgi:hypothetical protein
MIIIKNLFLFRFFSFCCFSLTSNTWTSWFLYPAYCVCKEGTRRGDVPPAYWMACSGGPKWVVCNCVQGAETHVATWSRIPDLWSLRVTCPWVTMMGRVRDSEIATASASCQYSCPCKHPNVGILNRLWRADHIKMLYFLKVYWGKHSFLVFIIAWLYVLLASKYPHEIQQENICSAD